MPLVRVEIIKGKDLSYKKTMLDAIQIEDWDRFQRLIEIDDELFERNTDKSDKFTIIEITMFPGRTTEQKAKIYENIVNGLNKSLGIKPSDIFIILNEPKDENWGLAGIQRLPKK